MVVAQLVAQFLLSLRNLSFFRTCFQDCSVSRFVNIDELTLSSIDSRAASIPLKGVEVEDVLGHRSSRPPAIQLSLLDLS